ncbi:MAG: tRNA (uridine(54)-C5)-methyltransferase TrmA [Succinivibrionaceae bacterium]
MFFDKTNYFSKEKCDSLFLEKVNFFSNKINNTLGMQIPYTYYTSEPINYRMRAEFSIFHIDNTFYYNMFEVINGKKKRILLDQFYPASALINKLMPIIKEEIIQNNLLKHKLFGIDFLSTLSNELLITLNYHKPLDDSWVNSIIILKDKLSKNFNINLNFIGRSRKQKLIVDKDFVIENLTVNNKVYAYKQIENSFTQPNARICENMLSWVQNKTLNAQGDLLELYCGNGNFSIVLSENYNKVLATEISKTSVSSAQFNIKKNNITNLKIIKMSSEEFTQAMNKEREFNRLKNCDVNLDDYNFSTVFVDPPRCGIDDKTISMISKFQNIIYISCNPDTLIKNLKSLSNDYNVKEICFFDQFPYTKHIETGCILHKK